MSSLPKLNSLQNRSIVSFLIDEMHLKKHTLANRRRVIKFCLQYLLGLSLYSHIYKELQEYQEHINFSRALRNLDNLFLKYVMFDLRKYAKTKKGGTINKLDKKVIHFFYNKLDYSAIKIYSVKLHGIPTQEEVLTKYEPLFKKKAYELHTRLCNDRAVAVEDIQSELSLKAIYTYRLYLFNYGSNNWNDKIFYSCIIKSITTKSIDLGYTFTSLKNSVHRFSKDIDDYNSLDSYGSLENYSNLDDYSYQEDNNYENYQI